MEEDLGQSDRTWVEAHFNASSMAVVMTKTKHFLTSAQCRPMQLF